MQSVERQKTSNDAHESEPRLYYVHKNIVFITEYVSIDHDEPLEIIQCCVDVGMDCKKGSVISTR